MQMGGWQRGGGLHACDATALHPLTPHTRAAPTLPPRCRYLYDHIGEMGALADATIAEVGFVKGGVITVSAVCEAGLVVVVCVCVCVWGGYTRYLRGGSSYLPATRTERRRRAPSEPPLPPLPSIPAPRPTSV